MFAVPIVALTGHSDCEKRERGLRASFIEYSAESLEIQWPVEVISMILENKKIFVNRIILPSRPVVIFF